MISSGGPLITQVTLNRKLIFEDESGTIHLTLFNNKVLLDSQPYGPFTKSMLAHYLDIQEVLEDRLRGFDINRVWCIVDSPERKRWVEFLGYQFNDESWNGSIDVMYKDI